MRLASVIAFTLVLVASPLSARVRTLQAERSASVTTPVTDTKMTTSGETTYARLQEIDKGISVGTVSRIYLRFDLTPIKEGDGEVNQVLLDWPMEIDLPDSSFGLFFLFVPPDSSYALSASSGEVPATSDEDLVDSSFCNPRYFARVGGGFVRFDITQLARDWVSDRRVNTGVVIQTEAVDEDVLLRQLGNVRLVVL